jgi:hypothetical protein
MSLLRYWKIVLGLVLVFGAGVVVGSVGTEHLIKRGVEHALNFDLWKAGVMRDLQAKLNLTTQQHAKIEALLDLHGREMRGSFSRTFNECGQVLVQLQREIDQELSPQQREIHAEMKRCLRAELKKRFNYDLPAE